jgi:hypothetical protein
MGRDEEEESHEKRQEEFYKKVQSVPIKDEHQLQLYQHCMWKQNRKLQNFQTLFI